MPFLLIGLLLLGRFLEEKKKEDGIYFALASSLALSTHFFTVIFAVVLCGSLVLVYLRKIWEDKMILPLFRCLILICCLSLTPFLIGKLEGKNWQGSMTWALSVMQTSESADSLDLDEEMETVEGQQEEEDSGKNQNVLYQFFHMMADQMYVVWGYVFWGGILYAGVYFLVIGKRR